jgi:acyl-CoA synthetase (AMP-forming)/AMP-acid ligase II
VHLVRGKQRVTYAELLDLVPRAAAVLADHGVAPGDRVMLLGFNSVEWIVGFWATLAAGAVVVLANPWWSEAEVRHALGVVDVALVLVDPRSATLVPPETAALQLEEMTARAATQEPLLPPPPAGEDQPAIILFTSGTSGPPKGAVLPHRSVIALQHMLLNVTRQLPHTLDDDAPREVALQTGPLFHIGGVQALVRQLLLGGTLVFPRGRFDPTEVLDLMESEGVHRWGGVPTMVGRVLNDPTIGGRDLSSVRAISLGGSPVPPELVARIKTRFPNVERGVSQVYGLSEGGGTLTAARAATSSSGPARPAGPCRWWSCASIGPTRRGRARWWPAPRRRCWATGVNRPTGRSMMTAGSTPATSATSTTTGTCSSPAG